MARKRNDGSERIAFRKDVKKRISNGESQQLEFLVDKDGNWHSDTMGWRDQEGNIHEYGKPGFHSNEGVKPGWIDTDQDASHSVSYNEDKPNFYALEERSQNRRDGALERQGKSIEKPAIEVDGIAVNKEQARTLEARGVFKEGTVEKAPEIVGWNKRDGIVRKDSAAKETSIAKNASDAPHTRTSQQNPQSTSIQEKQTMFENKKKKQAQAGPSPTTAGSFGGNGGDDNSLSKAKFGKGLEKYRQQHLAKQKSQGITKK